MRDERADSLPSQSKRGGCSECNAGVQRVKTQLKPSQPRALSTKERLMLIPQRFKAVREVEREEKWEGGEEGCIELQCCTAVGERVTKRWM